MTKITFTLFLGAFLTLTAAAQQPVVEAGQPEELKGVTRIHVSAFNKEARNNIIAEIKKRLPQVTITDRSEEAEVWLLFSVARRDFPKTNPMVELGGTRTSGTPVMEYEMVASGTIIKPVSKERGRRLIEFKETAPTITPFTGLALSTKFARAFVKSYRKANS